MRLSDLMKSYMSCHEPPLGTGNDISLGMGPGPSEVKPISLASLKEIPGEKTFVQVYDNDKNACSFYL